jgi:D-glycero-alpha-D-manno-heptose 1-phosphate guanylyltransferase
VVDGLMKVLVLAGGMGTRLREIVKDRPKPMALIGGRPFLEYLILQLKGQGFGEIVLCIGYLGEQIRSYFGDGDKWGVHISYSYEEQLLGTGGAIKLAEKMVQEENFLVMNGDSFLDVDMHKLINHHLMKQAIATVALVEVENANRYGAVEINEKGEIKKFVEKGDISASKLINGGVYVLNRKIFDYIPLGTVSLEKEIFPKLIGKGFFGVPIKGFFIDIGVPETYKMLQENPRTLLNALFQSNSKEREDGAAGFLPTD